MAAFETSLKVYDNVLDFSFRKVLNPFSSNYFVSVMFGNNNVASFKMKPSGQGGWKVVHPAPQWILNFEEELSLLISRHQ